MKRILLAAGLGAALAYLVDTAIKGRTQPGPVRGQALTEPETDPASWIAVAVAANDEDVVRAVESCLMKDPALTAGHVSVELEYGVVVLRGEVERSEEITVIERKALAVPGVERVDNLLHTAYANLNARLSA